MIKKGCFSFSWGTVAGGCNCKVPEGRRWLCTLLCRFCLGLFPARSSLMLNVKSFTITRSSTVLPSPVLLSSSLLCYSGYRGVIFGAGSVTSRNCDVGFSLDVLVVWWPQSGWGCSRVYLGRRGVTNDYELGPAFNMPSETVSVTVVFPRGNGAVRVAPFCSAVCPCPLVG